jgi:hypothetical protein
MKDFGIIVIVVGVALLAFKSTLANIGQSVENTLSNTWTGVAVIGIGAIMVLLNHKAVRNL